MTRDVKQAPGPLPVTPWHQTEPPRSVHNLDAEPVRILRVELKD